jgi:signal transduction histidine kinase
MGGDVSAESRIGEGARFTLRIPLEEDVMLCAQRRARRTA